MGWPRRYCGKLETMTHPRGIYSLHSSQSRRPATLLPYRGVLRVGAGNRAGPPSSGDSAFSSGAILALPGVRKSFVLRDDPDIKA